MLSIIPHPVVAQSLFSTSPKCANKKFRRLVHHYSVLTVTPQDLRDLKAPNQMSEIRYIDIHNRVVYTRVDEPQ